ncbi:MAG: polysaccharide pyruvyl transferase family protein [Colwellia sp.]|nr:polysaccharide pyruvyl transferase family protein [Colwellia sp.]
MNIKNFIPLKLKQKLNSYLTRDNINGNFLSNRKKIIVALAADYGNLGDVAISYAQHQFLTSNYPDRDIIDVPISRTLKNIRTLKKHLTDDDIITIVGGGNLTNKYQEIENFRLLWLKEFPNNKIISFPQTIDFSNDDVGKSSLSASFKYYNSHSKFHMFARESVSLKMMNEKLKAVALFCPDIVLSLNKSIPELTRKSITCCIRDDDESNLSTEQRNELIASIKSKYCSNVTFTDTHIGTSELSWHERQQALEKIWAEFKQSKVIVTDRLHGMIFSVITKTPCVVLTNNNHKIMQTYEDWLKPLPHIYLIREYNPDNIINTIATLLKIDTHQIALPNISDKYQTLKNCIDHE